MLMCVVCGAGFEPARTGRPRLTCSDRCRQEKTRKGRKQTKKTNGKEIKKVE